MRRCGVDDRKVPAPFFKSSQITGRPVPDKPPSPMQFLAEGGAFVAVEARESRAHGEGEQSVSRVLRPPGKAMYGASTADHHWFWIAQRRLYLCSWEEFRSPNYAEVSMES